MVTDIILLFGKVKEAAINATLAALFIGLPLGACALIDHLLPENTLPPTYNDNSNEQ
jgi:hypothetical protein